MLAAYQQYQRTQVSTAAPKAIVVMLFDRALLACKRAREAEARRDFTTKGKETSRAQAILSELSLGVNPDAAPELGQNLARLYQFWSSQVMQWSLGRLPDGLDAAERQMRDLRDAFVQAFGMHRTSYDE
jgi:flagellar secretion chaperone FliS